MTKKFHLELCMHRISYLVNLNRFLLWAGVKWENKLLNLN
jgi:hypothetical protein